MVHDDAPEPKRGLDTAPAVGFEFVADGTDGLDEGRVVQLRSRQVVIGRARDPDQPASLCDGQAAGPVITDVGPLLGNRAFF